MSLFISKPSQKLHKCFNTQNPLHLCKMQNELLCGRETLATKYFRKDTSDVMKTESFK